MGANEHPVQIIRSDPEIHFITAIAKQTYEMASLPMTKNVSNEGEIVGIKVSGTEDLDWVVWIFTRSNGHSETLSIERSDADIVSAHTIGDNGWTVINDQYNGYQVEIYGGTGIDQTRTILDTEANSGNGLLTVEPPWDTTPDATSDFRVHSRDPLAGHVTMTAMNPNIFGESGFRADLLYRWENRDLLIPYIDDEGDHQIHVALFNDEASAGKTNYAGGGRVQVQIDFRPHR